MRRKREREKNMNRPGLNENLLCSVGSAGCCCDPYIGCQFLKGVIGADRDPVKDARGLSMFLGIRRQRLTGPVHGRIVGG